MTTQNPVKLVKMFKEQNIRGRVLSGEEFQHLLSVSPEYLKPILLLAYYTGMRKGEILNLEWDMVDVEDGFIRLKLEHTKTGEGRSVPLSETLTEILRGIKKSSKTKQVFLRRGSLINSVRGSIYERVQKGGSRKFSVS